MKKGCPVELICQ